MKNPLNKESGIALFIVLWVLILMTVIAAEFGYTMRSELNIARNFAEETQAAYIAEAGINNVIYELVKEHIYLSYKSANAAQTEDAENIQWRVNADIPPISFGTGSYTITIENEAGKVNLNLATREILEMALSRFDLDEQKVNEIVDSIMDWRDEDHFYRTYGAEDDYYLSLSNPYECKDADFDSVNEVLFVKGMNEDIFYGGFKEMLTIYPDNDWLERKKWEERMKRKLSDDDSREELLDFEPYKICVNAAKPDFLLSLPSSTPKIVNNLLKGRLNTDIKNWGHLNRIIDSQVAIQWKPYVSLDYSPFYTIKSVGEIENSSVQQKFLAVVEVDMTLDIKYRILEWNENFDFTTNSTN